MSLPSMVRVFWIDSTSAHSTTWGLVSEAVEIGQKQTDIPCITVGFLIKRTEKVITLVSSLSDESVDDETECSGDMTIPICSICRIEELAPYGDLKT